MSASYDAVVIGGGHNGLVSAAYLARGGLKVAVLERRPILGGAVSTEELWKGFKIHRLSYTYSLFVPQVVEDLQLAKYGLRVISPECVLFTPFPDGKYIISWEDDERTAKEFAKFSAKDAKNYPTYVDFWNKVGQLLGPMMENPSPSFHDLATLFDNDEALELLRVLLFGSVAQLLDEYFESDYVKGALCPRGLIGSFVGPKTPGSAYVLAHHQTGGAAGSTGVWGYLKGGMVALIQALAQSAEDLGVRIAKSAEVVRIIVKDDAVSGVELADGRIIEARYILSNADARQTFLTLVGKEHFDQGFVRKVQNIRDEGCVVKVNAAIEELPDYLALPGKKVGPQHKGMTGIGPSIEYCERAYDDAKYGRPSTHPFMRVTTHTATDPDLAPPGKHTLSIFAQYYPYHLKNCNWDDIKEEVGDNILETLSEYAPNVKKSIIAREVISPLDMEREFRLPKGNIFHEEMTPDQLLFFRPIVGWSSYRTPIKGLYLCGSSAHPGGGISGAPGYNAAKALLADVRPTK